jgi:hypothetical protein
MKKTTTPATGVSVEFLNRFGDKISGRLMLTALRAGVSSLLSGGLA